MMSATCYVSLEIYSDTPLAVIASMLKDAAKWIETFEEGQELHEIKGFREGGEKIGQVDLDVEE